MGEILKIDEKKEKIRERYKGIDPDRLEIIPAVPQEDFYDENKIKRVAVYARGRHAGHAGADLGRSTAGA